jgi:hypothetical protein
VSLRRGRDDPLDIAFEEHRDRLADEYDQYEAALAAEDDDEVPLHHLVSYDERNDTQVTEVCDCLLDRDHGPYGAKLPET